MATIQDIREANERLRFDPLVVPLQVTEDGSVRVGGTRVTLETVIACYHQGDTPEAIVDAFDVLTLSDVYAVIAFYLSQRENVDAYLRDEEQKFREFQADLEKGWDRECFRRKIAAARADMKERTDAAAE